MEIYVFIYILDAIEIFLSKSYQKRSLEYRRNKKYLPICFFEIDADLRKQHCARWSILYTDMHTIEYDSNLSNYLPTNLAGRFVYLVWRLTRIAGHFTITMCSCYTACASALVFYTMLFVTSLLCDEKYGCSYVHVFRSAHSAAFWGVRKSSNNFRMGDFFDTMRYWKNIKHQILIGSSHVPLAAFKPNQTKSIEPCNVGFTINSDVFLFAIEHIGYTLTTGSIKISSQMYDSSCHLSHCMHRDHLAKIIFAFSVTHIFQNVCMARRFSIEIKCLNELT